MFTILCLVITIFVVVFKYKRYLLFKKVDKLKWIRSIPGYPIVGNAFEFHGPTETLNDLSRIHDRYGKLVLVHGVFDPFIIAADYDFLEFVLTTHNVLNKGNNYKFLHQWLGTGLLTSDGPKWRKRRKLITPAFHFSILQQFMSAFESNGKILIEKLKKHEGEDVDIYQHITLYALDVICESAMGVKVNAQEVTDSQYVRNVKWMCKQVADRGSKIFEKEALLYPLFPNYYREKRAVKQLHDFTDSVITSRLSVLNVSTHDRREKRVAFLDMILQSTVDGQPLSEEDIREEVDTFMFEGHDTTASAMSFASFLLANHQEVQKRALEEQKHIFDGDIFRAATYDDLQQMKYLECVLKETLRLYPPVPHYMRITDEDVLYKGNIIPKGVNIVINAHGIMRNPEHFPNPNSFEPTRFETNYGTKPFSFIPFSAGPRNCIGQKFAMLEMKSTISKILRNFHLLPTEPKHELLLTAEAVLKSRNGIKIRLNNRMW